jgi:hypothetical protein
VSYAETISKVVGTIASYPLALFKFRFGYGNQPPVEVPDLEEDEALDQIEPQDGSKLDPEQRVKEVGAYSKAARALRQKIAVAKIGGKDIDDGLEAARGLYHDEKFTEALNKIAELDRKVSVMIALAEVNKRIDVLGQKPCKNDKALKQITSARDIAREQSDLKALTGTIGPMLDDAESDVRDFEDARGRILNGIENLKTGPVPANTPYEELNSRLGKIGNLARTQVAEALKRLTDLEDEVDRAVEAADRERTCHGNYESLQEAVAKLREDMPKKSQTHRSYNFQKVDTAIRSAAKSFSGNEFGAAIGFLEEAQQLLAAIDGRASAKLKDLGEQEQKRAEEEQERLAREAQERLREQQQLALENAMNVASLTAIGKQRQFGKWFTKVKTLKDNGIVTLSGSNPYWLRGNNVVAVDIQVFPSGVARYVDWFTVHYHPDAQGPTTDDPYASQMHIKPVHGNRQTRRLDLNPGDWLITEGYAVTFGQAKRYFR